LRSAIEIQEGQTIEGVDLLLVAGGSLEGEISIPGDAKPAYGWLTLRDGEGKILRASASWSGPGRYFLSGLPPGTIELTCTTTRCVTAEPVSVVIRPKEVTQQDLRLVAGTRLRLRVPSGSPVEDLRVSVRDQAGVEQAVDPDWESSAMPAEPPSERVVGPLLPGTHTVALFRPGASARTERAIELHGEEEIVLDLELPR
jgi:hypothetical protein